MSIMDIIIVLSVAIILFLVIYFNIYKKNGNPCMGCSEYKKCTLKNCEKIVKDLKKYQKQHKKA